MVTAKGLRVLNSRPNTTTGDLYANKFEERQAERRRLRNRLKAKMPSKDMGLTRKVKDTNLKLLQEEDP